MEAAPTATMEAAPTAAVEAATAAAAKAAASRGDAWGKHADRGSCE
jgi:hypothetical protein